MAVTANNVGQQVALQMGWSGANQGAGGHTQWVGTLTPQQKSQYDAQIASMGGNPGAPVPTTTPLTQQLANNINNPQLPSGTVLNPILQQVQGNEVQGNGALLQGQAPTIQNPAQIQAPTIQPATAGQAQTVDPNAAVAGVTPQTVTPTMTQPVQEGQAAQMQVQDAATVQGQLASLFADTQTGTVPPWAVGAYNKAQEEMAARGLGSSSISAAAVTTAYMQSALPIAAQDAATYFQADLANLNNRQQMELQNLQNRQQNMLTDTAISNASQQFNATSTAQTQQFVSSMVSQIQAQNADRINSMNQFNTAQENAISATNAQNSLQASQANVQMQLAADQFNSNLVNQRDQFNSQMQFAIDQSNVLWRRSVNTANTAALNAANQTNVQNSFNLSTASLNAVWAEYADNADWLRQSATNQELMNYNAAIAAGNQDYLNTLLNEGTDFMDLAANLLGSLTASFTLG